MRAALASARARAATRGLQPRHRQPPVPSRAPTESVQAPVKGWHQGGGATRRGANPKFEDGRGPPHAPAACGGPATTTPLVAPQGGGLGARPEKVPSLPAAPTASEGIGTR